MRLGFFVAGIVATVVIAPAAQAVPPQPDPDGTATATFAEIGIPTATEVATALDWPNAVYPLGYSKSPSPANAQIVRNEGGPWVPERASQYDAYFNWEQIGANPPPPPRARPALMQTTLHHTTQLRDRAFSRLVQQTQDPQFDEGGCGEVEVPCDPSDYTDQVVVISSSPTRSSVWRKSGHDGLTRVTTVAKAGPIATVKTVCGPTGGPVTPEDADLCTDPMADLAVQGFEEGWPTIEAHWPDPTRSLLLPLRSRQVATLLSPRQVRAIVGTRATITRSVSLDPRKNWALSSTYRRGGRTSARVAMYRLGDAPAARTELAYRYRTYTRSQVVRSSPNTFTVYRDGYATVWRRASTGVIRTDCWASATGSRRLALGCAERMAAVQARESGSLFAVG